MFQCVTLRESNGDAMKVCHIAVLRSYSAQCHVSVASALSKCQNMQYPTCKCDESPLHIVSLGNSLRDDCGNAIGATKRKKL